VIGGSRGPGGRVTIFVEMRVRAFGSAVLKAQHSDVSSGGMAFDKTRASLPEEWNFVSIDERRALHQCDEGDRTLGERDTAYTDGRRVGHQGSCAVSSRESDFRDGNCLLKRSFVVFLHLFTSKAHRT